MTCAACYLLLLKDDRCPILGKANFTTGGILDVGTSPRMVGSMKKWMEIVTRR